MLVYIVAIIYFILSLILFFCTRKKYTGLFHFSLLLGMIPFVIRPVLSQLNNSWIIYPVKYQAESDYLVIYLTSIFFSMAFILGYLLKMLFFEQEIKKYDSKNINGVPRPYLGIFILLILMAYLFLVGGTQWLGNFRETVASKVVPSFRFIYPVAVFVSFFLAISTYFRVISGRARKLELVLIILFIFVCMTLLNTRGWFLSILILYICFYFSEKGFVLRKFILVGLIMFFVAFYMRSILNWIFGSSVVEEQSQTLYEIILAKFLYTSSGDVIDTWHVVFDYVYDNGYAFGQTIVGNIGLLLPSSVREVIDLKPAVDIVNYYYRGDLYYENNFGFNINLSQEMFINFGYFGALLLFFSGMLFRYFESRLFLSENINTKTILEMCVYYQATNVMTGLPFISWLIFFYVSYKVFFFIYRVKIR